MDLFPRKGTTRKPADNVVAAEDAAAIAAQAAAAVDEALGSEWYAEHGNRADRAAFVLCRLRRARGGQWRSATAGDDAVRAALGEASPEALIWLASRAISYMDENGFPEAAEPYVGD